MFDTVDYSKGHPLFSTKNKNVIAMFKDETDAKQIEEYVGLRAKLYSYKMLDKFDG